MLWCGCFCRFITVPCCRCHIILSNLRKPGEKAYKIPSGFLFNYVTCANYTAEIWGWILFTIGTRTLAAGLFTAAGAIQMADWARGKHRRLQKVRSCAALAAMRCSLPSPPQKKQNVMGLPACTHACLLMSSRKIVGLSQVGPYCVRAHLLALDCVVQRCADRLCAALHPRCFSCSCLMGRMAVRSTPSAGSCSHPSCD